MSVFYRTVNSKGISCFRKTEHGAVADVNLFFTCGAATLGPLAMGTSSDTFGDPKYGFILATGLSALLFLGPLLYWIINPARELLRRLDHGEYGVVAGQSTGVSSWTFEARDQALILRTATKVKRAPHTMRISHLDEVRAARKPRLRWSKEDG